jgi:regulator of RNase E activity RraA
LTNITETTVNKGCGDVSGPRIPAKSPTNSPDEAEIGGLQISSGDLLHGDLHGVHLIPAGAAGKLAAIAQQVLQGDRELFDLTEREDFSPDLLSGRPEEG